MLYTHNLLRRGGGGHTSIHYYNMQGTYIYLIPKNVSNNNCDQACKINHLVTQKLTGFLKYILS